MVSNSVKLDRRTSSTLNLESMRVTVPEIWPGQKWQKKKKKKKKKEKKEKKKKKKMNARETI